MYNVIKFGGTSVANVSNLKEIANYLKKRVINSKLIVVVSAMNKSTDELTTLASEITDNPQGRELDRLLSIGEQQTISLLALACNAKSLNTISLTADQLNIRSSNEFNNAKINNIDVDLINSYFEKHDILIVAGFQAVTVDNEITTLGRGGSDTTAVALAAALNTSCEIYTDVEGIYTSDPRILKNTKKLNEISHDEMSELASLGAGVMHNRSIILAKKYDVDIYVAKSLSKKRGTSIMKNINEQNVVTAITSDNDIINVTFIAQDNLLNEILQSNINIDMVSQLLYDDKLIIAFSTSTDNFDKILEIVDEKNLKINKELTKISLVGAGMRDASGVVNKIFKSLQAENINIIQTTSSEITVSLLIHENDEFKALKALSKVFDLEEK